MDDLEVIQVDVARRAAAVARAVAEVAVVEAEDGGLAVGLQPLHRHDPRLVKVTVGLRFLAENEKSEKSRNTRGKSVAYESEFSDSVSLSSPFWFFHFLKRSIKSIR